MPKFRLTIPVHVVSLEPKPGHYWTKDTEVSFIAEAPDYRIALESLAEILQKLLNNQV